MCAAGWKVLLVRKKLGSDVFTVTNHVNIGKVLKQKAQPSIVLAAARLELMRPISLRIKATPKVGN